MPEVTVIQQQFTVGTSLVGSKVKPWLDIFVCSSSLRRTYRIRGKKPISAFIYIVLYIMNCCDQEKSRPSEVPSSNRAQVSGYRDWTFSWFCPHSALMYWGQFTQWTVDTAHAALTSWSCIIDRRAYFSKNYQVSIQ